MTHRLAGTALVVGALAISACGDETLMPPTSDVNALFDKYVSIGNSIAAGFQSGGINDSTQMESYALIMATQMGLDTNEFRLPLLNFPGCPTPLVNVYTQERMLGIDIDTLPCAARDIGFDEFHFHNYAVPGAAVKDLMSNLDPASNPNPLTTFILGGRTQVDAALEQRPTFVSLEIGNNDALGAALSGDASLVTPSNEFDADFGAAMAALLEGGVQGGVLIAVFNVTNIPFLSAGGVYAALQGGGQLPPPPFLNLPNCATTGVNSLIPFSYGFPKIDSALAGASTTIDCANDAEVLVAAEVGAVIQAVSDYNTTIQNAATQAGWSFFDPNPMMDSLRALGEIPLFPTAPPDPASVTAPFGPWFSRDGVHPNAAAHDLMATQIIEAINATYDTAIPLP
jgi:lysophospholipase L1-like esterase